MKQDLETFYIIALILAKIFFRGIYLLTLFIAIGGLLHWGLYPTMKGLRLMDFYYIIPFILGSAGILILLSLLEQKFPHVKIMPLWKYDIYFNKACSLDYVHFVVFFYCNGMVRRFHV